MRELKFRAWLDEYKQYIYFGGDYKEQAGRWGKGCCALLGNNYIAELYANEDSSNMYYQVHKVECIEQCTGLKDRNGEKICEGDIVLDYYDGDDAYIVEWDEDTASFRLTGTDNIASVSFDNFYSDKDLEVIGNIHENPELLEHKG